MINSVINSLWLIEVNNKSFAVTFRPYISREAILLLASSLPRYKSGGGSNICHSCTVLLYPFSPVLYLPF